MQFAAADARSTRKRGPAFTGLIRAIMWHNAGSIYVSIAILDAPTKREDKKRAKYAGCLVRTSESDRLAHRAGEKTAEKVSKSLTTGADQAYDRARRANKTPITYQFTANAGGRDEHVKSALVGVIIVAAYSITTPVLGQFPDITNNKYVRVSGDWAINGSASSDGVHLDLGVHKSQAFSDVDNILVSLLEGDSGSYTTPQVGGEPMRELRIYRQWLP
jgi:hypothetical protein